MDHPPYGAGLLIQLLFPHLFFSSGLIQFHAETKTRAFNYLLEQVFT